MDPRRRLMRPTNFSPRQIPRVQARRSCSMVRGLAPTRQMTIESFPRSRTISPKFLGYTMAQFNVEPPPDGFITYGSCQIRAVGAIPTHLNAGPTLTVSGPGGAQVSASLSILKSGAVGDYKNALPSGFIPPGGGTFTFSGPGPGRIGAISSASVTMPAPLIWTNMIALSSIDRAKLATLPCGTICPITFLC